VNHGDSIVALRVARPAWPRPSRPLLDPDHVNLDARKVDYEIVGVNTEAL
jgi:hypothetical protein